MILTNKGRRAALCGANALGFFALLFGHVNMSGMGVLLAIALLVVASALLVKFRPEDEPATTDLAMLVCVDLLAFFAFYIDIIKDSFDPAAASAAMSKLSEGPYMMFAMLGVVVFILGLAVTAFLMGIGAGMFGTALFLTLYTTGEWPHLEYGGNAMSTLTTYVVASVFFSVCLYLSSCVSKTAKKSFAMLTLPTIVCCVVWIVVSIGCGPFANALSGQVAQIALGFPANEFAWWRVLLTCVALLALAYAFAMRTGERLVFDLDAIVLCGWAAMVAGVRVLMDCYFMHCWLLMLALITAICPCIRNAAQGEDTAHMKAPHWIALSLIVFILLVSLLSQGLWPSVAVGIPLVIVLFWQVHNYKEGAGDTRLALTIIAAFVSEAIAWQGMRHNSVSSFLMLGMVAVFAAVTVVIINRKAPGGQGAPKILVYGVCACVALLCWLSLRPAAKVSAETKPEGVALTIEETRGDRKIVTVTYQWQDAMGTTVVPDTPLPVVPVDVPAEPTAETPTEATSAAEAPAVPTLPAKSTATLPVVADHLVVRVRNEQGITACYDYYFAPWMHGFKQAREALGIAVEQPAPAAEGEQAA